MPDFASQLAWIQRNRQRRSREVRLGSLVRGAIESGRCPDGEVVAALREAVDAVVDDEFRRLCKLARVRQGRLIVEVGSMSAVSMMRVKWRERVLRAAGKAVTNVVFVFGGV